MVSAPPNEQKYTSNATYFIDLEIKTINDI